jgi:hypothetical protein
MARRTQRRSWDVLLLGVFFDQFRGLVGRRTASTGALVHIGT